MGNIEDVKAQLDIVETVRGYVPALKRSGRGSYQGRDLVLGYRFRGRVELKSGSAAWCKENPPPLHADQEEFVKVPVSRDCTG